MRSIKNHNITQYVALYSKGIGVVVRTFDSLTKKDKKKIVNYLVVPNNFILSLSHIGATGVTSPQNILAYAREAPLRNSFRLRISRRILCLIFHVLSSTSERMK